MEIRVTMNSVIDAQNTKLVWEKLLSGVRSFELDVFNSGMNSKFDLVSYDRNTYYEYWTLDLTLKSSPKSLAVITAENAVNKAKEALKAAEEALKITSGKL